MSTKIYDGVRFPRSRLAEFVEVVRVKGLTLIRKRAMEMTQRWAMSSPEAIALIEHTATRLNVDAPGRHQPDFVWRCRVEMTLRQINLAAQGSMRTMPLFDMACGWRIWLPRGPWVLAIPWGESHLHVKLPAWVEDYSYWNNTDPPDDVSDRAWAARASAWDSAGAPWHQNHPLRVDTFTVGGGGHEFDMIWLELCLMSKGRSEKPGTAESYLRGLEQQRKTYRAGKHR